MSQQARNRKKAEQLGAVDAKALIATVPYLAQLLSGKEIAQLQKVLDAAVLNPTYQKKYEQAMRNATKVYGDLVYRDKRKARLAYKILDQKVRVSKSDSYIRLDHNKMLMADALSPRTNNPDELAYLVQLKSVINRKGVWLHLEPKFLEPGRWHFWFTLGANGSRIPTKDAKLDRDELIKSAGGYYDAVTTGPMLTALKRQIGSLEQAHNRGRSTHESHVKIRRQAGRLVTGASDLLGGADFPDTKIWDLPFNLRMKAWDAFIARDVIKTQVFLLASAIAVEENGKLLAKYLKKTTRGASRAVTVLKVARAAGYVADATLGVSGLVKVLGRKAVTTAVRRKALDDLAERYLKHEMKRKGITEAELSMIRTVRTAQQSGTKLGSGMRAGQSTGAGTGFHKGY